jgi:diketogulonate reductase-like aldo/keto reductase
MTIQPVQLGDSRWTVAPVGLGTYQFDGTIDDLRSAIGEHPVLVDTSSLYGTEEIVGRAATGYRESFFVATKVFPDKYRPDDLKQSARQSLARTGLDYIDLLQLHWPADTVPISDTIGAMEDLVDEGLVRAIGVCNFRAHELGAALDVCTRHRLVSNQFAYSLYDRRFAAEIPAFCDEQGVTVIAYSPLAGQGPDTLISRDRDGVLARIAAREAATPAQVAIAWTLRGGRAVSIPKSSSADRIRENAEAARVQLSDEDRADLEASVQPRRVRSGIEERARLVVRRTIYTPDGRLTAAGRMIEQARDGIRAVKSRIR